MFPSLRQQLGPDGPGRLGSSVAGWRLPGALPLSRGLPGLFHLHGPFRVLRPGTLWPHCLPPPSLPPHPAGLRAETGSSGRLGAPGVLGGEGQSHGHPQVSWAGPPREDTLRGRRGPAGRSPSLQIAGFWREVGVASDRDLVLKTPRRLEALFLSLSGGNLTVKVVYNSSGSCETENMVGLEEGVPGRFAFPGHREIHVLDTDYERYAILRVSLKWQGRDFGVLKYFSRSLEDEDEPGFWKFRELTADTGLYLVARQGRCARLLKEVSLRPGLHRSPLGPAG
ncbi:epididymal-specific lipocalin-8 isoform X2 [Dasypus novemcinctus]|uniref:epididymal-specific lipocalin-8 isoform X2 n=1 Tax=Dasypus novemcinctus TaxID=9361 RepID=UPI000C82CED4|nr:epididymal-specific lipocalin-8 isoform X2 [Dasypus novemcinctus]